MLDQYDGADRRRAPLRKMRRHARERMAEIEHVDDDRDRGAPDVARRELGILGKLGVRVEQRQVVRVALELGG